jgi:anaerobic ribonucleoside-triphosphate reductase
VGIWTHTGYSSFSESADHFAIFEGTELLKDFPLSKKGSTEESIWIDCYAIKVVKMAYRSSGADNNGMVSNLKRKYRSKCS